MTGTVGVERLPDGSLAARFTAMASPCEVLIDGIDDLEQLRELGRLAAEECWRVEAKWSRYLPGNIVDRVNRSGGQPVEVDEETARLLDFGALLHAESGGRFDLTAGVLRRAWRFGPGSSPPDAAAVEALLGVIGWHRVQWRSPVLTLRPGMEIDFGGIGKEYAVDRALHLLASAVDAPALVNCGGDLAASRRRRDGSPWRIGIDSGVPQARTPLVRLAAGAVATSGDHHRHLVSGGKRYGHVLDPRTGWPPADAPRSVTVARPTCVEAGALSTVAILHGAGAEAWLTERQVDFHIVR